MGTGRNDGAILVVGGSGGQIRVWKYDESARLWDVEVDIKPTEGYNSPINDIAWAPTAGKSFHQVASCSSDGILVHRLVYNYENNQAIESFSGSTSGRNGKRLQLQESNEESQVLEYKSPQHISNGLEFRHQEVWRVAWNITGTLGNIWGGRGCGTLEKEAREKTRP